MSRSNKGVDLERRFARVEWGEGALVRVQVPVTYAGGPSGREDLTDVDVMSIAVDGRLSTTRSIAECKAVRGQKSEADRLFWLAGLRTYTKADRASLVRETVSARGRFVASAMRLDVIDLPAIERRETAHAWLPERFAHIGGVECASLEAEAKVQLKRLGDMPQELVQFLMGESLTANTHTLLGKLSWLRRTMETGVVLPDEAGLALAGHSLVALVLAIVRVAGTVDTTPLDRIRQLLLNGIVFGNPNEARAPQLLARADSIVAEQAEAVHSAYLAAGSKRQVVPVVSMRDAVLQEPDWVDSLIDLAVRYRNLSGVASTLPRSAELVCFEIAVGGDSWPAEAFSSLLTVQHGQLFGLTVDLLEAIVGEGLASWFEVLRQIKFDRTPPALPEPLVPFVP